jgi:hypothetical protein
MTKFEIGDVVRVNIKSEYQRDGWQGMEGIVTGFHDSLYSANKLVQFKVTKEATGGRSERKVGDLVNDMGLLSDKVELVSRKFKVGDEVKYINSAFNYDYGRNRYRVSEFVDAGNGVNHLKVAILNSKGEPSGINHIHAQSDVELVKTVQEGKEIALTEIKEGMEILATATEFGIIRTRQSVVAKVISSYGGSTILQNRDGYSINAGSLKWTFTLVKDVPKVSPNLAVLRNLPSNQVVWQSGVGHFVQTGLKTGGEWTWLHMKNRSQTAVVVTNKEVAEALDNGAVILKVAA